MNKALVSTIALCTMLGFAAPAYAQMTINEADREAAQVACDTLVANSDTGPEVDTEAGSDVSAENSSATEAGDSSATADSPDGGNRQDDPESNADTDSTDGTGTEGETTLSGTFNADLLTLADCEAAGLITAGTSGVDSEGEAEGGAMESSEESSATKTN